MCYMIQGKKSKLDKFTVMHVNLHRNIHSKMKAVYNKDSSDLSEI